MNYNDRVYVENEKGTIINFPDNGKYFVRLDKDCSIIEGTNENTVRVEEVLENQIKDLYRILGEHNEEKYCGICNCQS